MEEHGKKCSKLPFGNDMKKNIMSVKRWLLSLKKEQGKVRQDDGCI